MKSLRVVLAVLMLLLALMLAACSSGQITTSLKLAITAAEIAIPVVAGQAGLSPDVAAAASTYLRQANQSLTTVTAILDAGGPAAVQAAKITAALAAVAKVDLPPGTPQSVVSALQQVATAVSKVLANFAVNGKPKLMKPGTTIKLTDADRKNLAEAKARLSKNQEALKKLPH